jgi:hypothetical protein
VDACVAIAVVSIVIFVIWAVVKALGGPSNCGVCGSTLKRARYEWTASDGTVTIMCANCNRTMERKKSKAAMKARYGD